MIPEYLMNTCLTPFRPLCNGCSESVKRSPWGRFYITMGHPGFNTSANNANGYATEASARAVVRHFANKGK